MSRLRPSVILCTVCSLAAWNPSRRLEAQDTERNIDETTRSAIFLLQMSMQVHRKGQHHLLQRALRQLEDPALNPLFRELAQHTHPDLQMHGILGLAECNKDRKLDLVRVAELRPPPRQAELISHAMDSGLLDNEQAAQLMKWSDQIDLAVKVLVAAPLIRDGELEDKSILKEATQSDNVARRSLAALLLLQHGESSARWHLDQLNEANEAESNKIRMMLLNTADRFALTAAGPWAVDVANELEAPSRLMIEALRVALRLGTPDAEVVWQRKFDATTDTIDRTRLALVALTVASQLPVGLFDSIQASQQPLIQQIGATGAAIRRDERIPEEVTKLMKMHHTIANEWSLRYAKRHASAEDAPAILREIILAYEGPERNRALRLDNAMLATQLLFDRDPGHAAEAVGVLLTSSQTSRRLKNGILFGLIRCGPGTDAHEAVTRLEPFRHQLSKSLRLLLIAKHRRSLPRNQLDELGLLVRGGGLSGPLRIQAAWRYLVLTEQVDVALKEVLHQPITLHAEKSRSVNVQ